MEVGIILDTVYPAGSEPITKAEFLRRVIHHGTGGRANAYQLATAKLNADAALYTLMYGFGALRLDGQFLVRTDRNDGPADMRYVHPPARETRQALYDAEGQIVDVPHSRVSGFLAARREKIKQRKVEQIKKDLREAGIDPATVGGLA